MKPFLKVSDPPENLCLFISVVGQGHDEMIIDLRDGIPMAKPSQTFPVCFKDLLIDGRKILLQPGKEGGTKIETDGGVIIDDIQNLPSCIDNPSVSIGPVALKSDPFIPVMKGMGAFFGLNDFEPGVLPGRLIEMTMNGDKCILHLWIIRHD
jgi:hypothetical protein